MTVRRSRVLVVAGTILAAALAISEAQAQSLGTFRWQLQPYCNVVAVNIVQNGAQYHLDGVDDQCGAPRRASLVGLAFPNPDGTIGFGFTIVTAPGGVAVHVDATVSLPAVSGTWRDSAGHTGTFALTPGAGTGGNPRPAPVPTSTAPIIFNTVTQNTAFGTGALIANTTGYANTAVGANAAGANTTGRTNTALGEFALANNTTGNDNVAIGSRALEANVSASFSTAVGANALRTSRGTSNTAVGFAAMGSATTAFGNVAYGKEALYSNQGGLGNVAIGDRALYAALGNGNIALGTSAGSQTAGSNNIMIGDIGETLDNSTIRLGNPTHAQTFITGIFGKVVPQQNGVTAQVVYVGPNGKLGSIQSSRRFKKDILDMGEASRRLFALRPVTFRYIEGDPTGTAAPDYGLIAEEVAEVYPDLVLRDTDGTIQSVHYHKLVPMLLNEIQRLERERTSLAATLEALARDLADLRATTGTLRR